MAAFQSGTTFPSFTRNDFNVSTHVASSTLSPSSIIGTSIPTPAVKAGLESKSSLLLGFLITFLAFFVTFLTFGLGWRLWSDRRRRQESTVADAIRERLLEDAIPKLWEVWVSPGGHHWRDMQPLSAVIAPPTTVDPSSADSERRGTQSTRPNLLLGRIFSRFGGQMAIPRPMQRPPPLRDGDEKMLEEHAMTEINHTGLEIAVLIALPDSERTMDHDSSIRSGRPEIQPASTDRELGNYSLGLARVPPRRPL